MVVGISHHMMDDEAIVLQSVAQGSPVFCENELCSLAGGESMTKPSRIKGQVAFGQRDLYMLNIAKCLNFVFGDMSR